MILSGLNSGLVSDGTKNNLMFRKVVEDLVTNKEVNIISRYESLAAIIL